VIIDLPQSATGTVDVVVVGAGHCGLAISHYLTAASIDHVILERGEVANSWRRERWDSLRLLTPNWQSRLPGFQYAGERPDAYMDMSEVIDFISGYAAHSQAPVHTATEVISVQPATDGYRVITNRGEWQTRALVIASGACNLPAIPALAAHLPASIQQVTPRSYRNPDQLEDGGVLVVGASATGLQLAEEIQISGRPVTLAVGEHVRLPRTYRGLDIQWWMDVIGLFDEGLDSVDDVARVRGLASPQLIGSDERRTLDLNALTSIGVSLVGRLAGIRDRRAQFSGSLRNLCALADLKMNRLLDSIDHWIDTHGYVDPDTTIERPQPTRVDDRPALGLDLGSGEIRSVVWATGYRPDYSWLEIPVLDRKGRLRHDGGIVDAPGVYAMGLPFMRRRKSSFIHGADDDAREISENLKAYLDLQSQLRLAG
jgi:putative flavoprotein involved in K+ transport